MKDQRKLLIKPMFIMVASIIMICSCKKSINTDNSVHCGTAAMSFAADANPVIQASCAFDSDCHGSGSTSGPGSLLNYAQIFNARSDIRSAILSGSMPKNSSLTTSQKTAIICWIDNGAANN